MRPPLAAPLLLLLAATALACASPGDDATPRATPQPPEVPASSPAPGAAPPSAVATPVTAVPTPAATVAPPSPEGPRGGQGASPPTAATGEWTSGVVAVERPGAGVAVLEELRAARHDGFDRIVFGFAPQAPGYHLEYVDRPVRACGSGEPVPLPGDGWLEVRLEPAAAHTEAGEPTVGRQLPVDLAHVRKVVLTCDFEAVVTWVLAVGSPNHFRVTTLDSPPRLVVDVQHH